MSTLDLHGLTPGELSLVAPSPASSPSTPPLPSPGVGLAATKIPTAPTTPDDPTSVHLAAARQSPPSSLPSPFGRGVGGEGLPSPFGRDVGGEGLPSSPSSTRPDAPLSIHGEGLGVRSTPPNPFAAEPNFATLFDDADAFSVPLLDEGNLSPPFAQAPLHEAARGEHETSPFADRDAFALPASARPSSTSSGVDANALRAEFPILQERVHGKRLIWLDNAATTQKPQVVIDRLKHFYEHENSNIHRAAHTLAARATDAYEGARDTVRRFLNASSKNDVVFVRGTTEGINLVAQTFGRLHVKAGDAIVVSHLEHHANIVPWQLLAKERGAELRVIPVDDRGAIDLDGYARLLDSKVKLVSFTQVSNALGTITPAATMIAMAKERGIPVLLDGAQSVSHMRVDLQALQPDFFVFSGHKVFGPTGIGAVVAKESLWNTLPPWQGGGNMIEDVTFERTRFHGAPARFEAGTGNIADAVGLGAALQWVERVGIDNIGAHEHSLLEYGTERLLTVPGLRLIGTAPEKAGVLSFVVDGHDPMEMSAALDQDGIATRGGHHCAQPILRRMGVERTVRASLAPYNTHDDLDALVDAVCRLVAAKR